MSFLSEIFGQSRAEKKQDHRLDVIERQLKDHMASTKERLEKIEADLTEGFDEVNGEIAKLREAIANGDPAAIEKVLARVEAKAGALKDIIPNAPPAQS